jgi:alkylhydroperoxidase family enzyme
MADAKLNALARFTLAMHETNGFVSDEDLAMFKAAGYTHAHVAEVVAVYALAIYTNTFNHVNDTVSDFPAAPRI